MKHKERLDVLLVSLGLAESRAKAQATIMAGEVYVNGQKADKSGMEVDITSNIEVRGSACPYVSRGGLKLEKALRNFGVDRQAMFAATPAHRRAGLPTACFSRGKQGLCHRRGLRPAGVENSQRPARRRHGADEHPLCYSGRPGRAA